MESLLDLETAKKDALKTLEDLEVIHELLGMDCPGHFVFSVGRHRIKVRTMDELHEVRSALRKKFGWTDSLTGKFFSCNVVIATYAPEDGVILPFPFELWLESPPETFPKEVMGNCKLVPVPHQEFSVICDHSTVQDVQDSHGDVEG